MPATKELSERQRTLLDELRLAQWLEYRSLPRPGYYDDCGARICGTLTVTFTSLARRGLIASESGWRPEQGRQTTRYFITDTGRAHAASRP